MVDREARGLEVQRVGGADPPGREQQHLGVDGAAIGEFRHGPAVLADLDRGHGGAEPQRDVAVAQIVDELVDQFLVDEVEEGRARLDQGHGDIERAEDRRIFDPDDACPDHGQAARQFWQIDDLVAVEHVDAVERHIIGAERTGAAGDQDVGRRDEPRFAAFGRDLDAVRGHEPGLAARGLDRVSAELVLQNFDFVVERLVQAGDEIGRRDVLLDPVGAAVKAALAPARQVEHGFAQRLGRDGPGMDRYAADPAALFDHQHRAVELCPLHGGAPSGRAAADDDQVVVVHGPAILRHRRRAVPAIVQDAAPTTSHQYWSRCRSDASPDARRPGPGRQLQVLMRSAPWNTVTLSRRAMPSKVDVELPSPADRQRRGGRNRHQRAAPEGGGLFHHLVGGPAGDDDEARVRRRSGAQACPDELVERIMSADILPYGQDRPIGRDPGGAMHGARHGIENLPSLEIGQGPLNRRERDVRRDPLRIRGPGKRFEILDAAKPAAGAARHGTSPRQMRMEPRRHEVDPERDALLALFDRNATDIGRRLDYAFGQAEPVGEIFEIGRGQHHDAEGHVGEIDLDRHLRGHGPLDRTAHAVLEADGDRRKGTRGFGDCGGAGLAHR